MGSRQSHVRQVAGFTLIELIAVIALVAILAAVLLERVARYQELSEKAAMEHTVGTLRSALTMQAAARILQGGLGAVAGLADENPMDWLAQRPPGYVGALFDPGESDVPKGAWYFDLKSREVVYRPRMARFLAAPADGRIRFRAAVRVNAPADRAGELSELTVAASRPYRWSPEF